MHIREFIEKNYPEYYSIERYPADKCAPICKVDGPWGVLSNFGRTPITIDGITFDCSEKLFQMIKFTDDTSRKTIFSAKGRKIKMMARHFEKVGTVREDWGRIIVDVMKYCIVQKYAQSAEFRAELERSRGLYIVEDQTIFNTKTPNTWGVKLSDDGTEYVGPNLLGRLLMELRDANGSLAYSLPSDATCFQACASQ